MGLVIQREPQVEHLGAKGATAKTGCASVDRRESEEEVPRTCWSAEEEPWKEVPRKGASWLIRVKQGRMWTVKVDRRPPGVLTLASPLALERRLQWGFQLCGEHRGQGQGARGRNSTDKVFLWERRKGAPGCR